MVFSASFPVILFFVFLVLKLCAVISWSWIWIFCPLWILPMTIVGTVLLVLLITIPIAIIKACTD